MSKENNKKDVKDKNETKKAIIIVVCALLFLVIVTAVSCYHYFYKNLAKDKQNYVTVDSKDNNIGTVVYKEVDQNNNPIIGAKTRLEKQDGSVIGEVETGTDGIITFYKVPVGNYKIVLLDEPAGYARKTKSVDFEVILSETTNLTVQNEKITGELTITCTDDKSAPLASMKFNLYDSEGYLITQLETDEEGKVSKNLEYGIYYFKQADVPEGYIMDEKMYKIEINKENRTFIKNITDIRYKGSLYLKITDNEENPIEGVKIKLTDENNNTIDEITSNEKGLGGMANIPYGKYYFYISEIPDNYDIEKSDYIFVITNNDQVITKTIVCHKK